MVGIYLQYDIYHIEESFKKQKDRMENSNKYKDYYIFHECYNYYSVAH